MFLNISNHSSEFWSEEQLKAAQMFGEIRDYPFPSVQACATREEIIELAGRIVANVVEMQPEAVMCQGEFTLTYALVKGLKEKGVTVLAACTERNTKETQQPDGTISKTSIFKFVQFREY